MKRKGSYVLNFLWTCLIAYSFPICFGLIYMDITGHSKGYGYDLGSEAKVSVMMGVFELIAWVLLAIPSNIYIFKKTKEKNPYYLLIIAAIYLMLAALCIVFMGGWSEFERFFHA